MTVTLTHQRHTHKKTRENAQRRGVEYRQLLHDREAHLCRALILCPPCYNMYLCEYY